MKVANKLTEPQRKALMNIANGRSSSFGLTEVSQMGEHTGTMTALYRDGLVTIQDTLTERGRDVVHALGIKPLPPEGESNLRKAIEAARGGPAPVQFKGYA